MKLHLQTLSLKVPITTSDLTDNNFLHISYHFGANLDLIFLMNHLLADDSDDSYEISSLTYSKLKHLFFFFKISSVANYGIGRTLTLKAPITTVADDKFCDIFPNFEQK